MPRYRNALPQLAGGLFLADGGMETTFIFHNRIELPHFAAFMLFRDDDGTEVVKNYYRTYAEIARRDGVGVVLESNTWRASPDWAALLDYSADALAAVNRKAVTVLEEIRTEFETDRTKVVISGCIGPRGDGYVPSQRMPVGEAECYHAFQVETFADTAVDLVTAATINYVEEAIGVVQAAKRADLPVVISFTTETDGRLPTGQPLGEAIAEVDRATGRAPAYYAVNCAHPSHFAHSFTNAGAWSDRIRAIRANASKRSHAELNEASELDTGDPVELGSDYVRLKKQLRNLNVLGGCCGTDHRHVDEISKACAPLF